MSSEDATLLHAWRHGDKRAGRELFARYYDLVARFFSNKVSTDRADLVQGTFMACLEKVDQLRNAESFRSFLFSIARFELLHYYRRKHKREVAFDSDDMSICDLDPSPSAVIAQHQEQRLLLQGLRRIPVDLQIVLELSYWEKMNTPEIASALGIAPGTVKSRVRRAREKLDAALAEIAESPALLESTVANLEDWANGLRGQLLG